MASPNVPREDNNDISPPLADDSKIDRKREAKSSAAAGAGAEDDEEDDGPAGAESVADDMTASVS